MLRELTNAYCGNFKPAKRTLPMLYREIAETYLRIEKTSKRIEITSILVDLFHKTSPEIVDRVSYLSQGKIYPDYAGLELGIAEKMAARAVSKATRLPMRRVEEELVSAGDLGTAIEHLLETRSIPQSQALTVEHVYNSFVKAVRSSGKGSSASKVDLLVDLVSRATGLEAKYIIRTATGKLRLGVGDMTILDALAEAYGEGKKNRVLVERAYNLSSDLGEVAKALAVGGIEGVRDLNMMVGRPIRPMLCERMSSAKEILQKMGGRASVEYKYDGLRIQVHIYDGNVELYSRRLERLTDQFPDLVGAIRLDVFSKRAILDGECVAVDPDSGAFEPFQMVTHRRRKFGIEKSSKEIPVLIFFFDILYEGGRMYVDSPYLDRMKALRKAVREGENVRLAEGYIVDNAQDLEDIMMKAIESGCEGVVVKSIGVDSFYRAGARGFMWVKYKRDYRSEMADSVDLVVVGAFAGRGKRTGTYGALLTAAYDEETDTFRTVSRLGTGFDDKTLKEMPRIFKVVDHRHPRVDSKIQADFWFSPDRVIEVIGAELTLSPSHTCGLSIIKKDAGIAIRFPRFTGKWRGDKSPEDATTVDEIVYMYRSQLKRIAD